MKPLEIAVIQNDAGREVASSLERIRALSKSLESPDLIALPEVFACKGSLEDSRGMAETIPGPQTGFLAELARSHNAWVLGGSLVETSDDGDTRCYNTSVLLNREGQVRATYRKIHLFRANLAGGTVLAEADAYLPGAGPVMTEIEGWRVGMSICYDLRFPELYREYAGKQADLIFIPANFTRETGQAHWHTLLRARAIENQCFVVAPNQCGTNEANGVASYGHSVVYDPWGETLAEGAAEEVVLTARLDPAAIQEARDRVPAVFNRIL